MDTKVLYVTAIVIAAVSGGYYWYGGKSKKLEADAAQSMNYSAEGIRLVQTDAQGNLHVRAEIDRLQQDLKNKTSKVENVHASMYKDNVVDATFYAKQGNGYDDNEKVILTGQVKATKIGEMGQMVFQTDELTVHPKVRTLETTKQVNVNAPNGEFISQGLQADLNQGQYEFFNIRGKYAPN